MSRLVFLAGFAAWLSALWACALVDNARMYATFWTGAVAAVAAVFVVGYVCLSRPSPDENGRRRWVGEWFWILAFPLVCLIVYTNSFVFRLIIPAPAMPAAEQILAQRVTAGISASVFFLLLWLTVMWGRRQREFRHERRLRARESR